jgi:hypothetical protein
VPEALERVASHPTLAILAGCCASAITPRASNTTATKIDGTAAFFIAHLVSSVIYHADVNKEKCNSRRDGIYVRRVFLRIEMF